ncbi:helix-turn-helix domain-containing protein [Streptomyces sp. NPDC057540]|uniref:helix-turn-helix domain-containing protein n=1 Tax=Streptomyces sp. NPDC057540 TaxID=3346160 RepID=UPI00367506AC
MCTRCGNPFRRQSTTGRAPKYCSPACRTAAFRARKSRPAPRANTFDQELALIGESIASRARLLAQVSALPVPALPLEPLQQYIALQRDLDDYLAVAVRHAIDSGADWADASAAISSSISSLKSQFSTRRVRRLCEQRRLRRPVPVPALKFFAKDAEPDRNPSNYPSAGDVLARALSWLCRQSGVTVRDIAMRADMSPSHIYRMMSGERRPSWRAVEEFARACDAKPSDFKYLWTNLHRYQFGDLFQFKDKRPWTPADLVSALRGLYLAEGRPPLESLLDEHPAIVSAERRLISDLLSATPPLEARPPSWTATAELVKALRHDPGDIQPLWEAAHTTYTQTARLLQAGSFG